MAKASPKAKAVAKEEVVGDTTALAAHLAR